jgi:phage-related protein
MRDVLANIIAKLRDVLANIIAKLRDILANIIAKFRDVLANIIANLRDVLANIIAKFSFYLAINSGLISSVETVCECRENYMIGNKYIEWPKYINVNVSTGVLISP